MRITEQRSIAKSNRQRKVAEIFKENGYISTHEVAQILNVSNDTIRRDINEITEILNRESAEFWQLHRLRVLKEINGKKKDCDRKFALCRGATAGTRWVEEWTKLVEKECKILGIYAPARSMVDIEVTAKISKEQRDAATKAIISNPTMIDVTPRDDTTAVQ